MRLLIFLSLISLNSFSQNIESCLKSDFSSQISNSDFLWGLVKYELNISKKRCVIKLLKDKGLKSEWEIDICREPIHIKAMQYFTKKEYIKDMTCSQKSKNTFCKKTAQLLRLLEKEALIHALGEREDLNSQHGQVYCLYKLINEYLMHDEVFSMNRSYVNAQFHGVSFGGTKTDKKMSNTFVEPVLSTTTSTTQSVYITEDEIKEGKDPVESNAMTSSPEQNLGIQQMGNEALNKAEMESGQAIEKTTLEEVEEKIVKKAKAEASKDIKEAFKEGVDMDLNTPPVERIDLEPAAPKVPAVEKLDSF